ncbi:hypothetical protein LCGC14_0964860 [marine sediment metagenome]|uniref:DNA methylase N-4/N-6 domain-containing protein n=1 Tax=marine sediment metagenome TaxID=412755 RepID=A0A0F9NHV1_9ZZZZ
MARRPRKASIQNRVVELRHVLGRDLLANPRNWRQHPEAQQAALAGVLNEVGFAGAVLARETPEGLVLIDGHLRAATLPDMLLPVLVLDVTEEEADKILATYDPLGAMARPDQDVLLSLLRDVEFQDKAVSDMLEALANGETLPMPDRTGLTDPDDVPPVPEDPYVKLGDLWQLGDHRVLCGDCTKQEDVERLMEGQLAQLVVTDPPYGVEYDGTHLSSGTYFGEGQRQGDRILNDDIPGIYASVIPMMALHTDEGAAAFVFFAGAKGLEIYQAVEASPWEARALIIWNKNHAQFGSMGSHYKQKHEPILYLYKPKSATRWHGAANEVTVWDYDRSSRNEWHIKQKPVPLMERPIANHSVSGDIVLDPFLGSGSTLMAAEKLHRLCYGMEIEPRYVQVTIERWQDYTGGKAILLSKGETPTVKP